MAIDLPAPLLPRLLNGLLGSHSPLHGHVPGSIPGEENDSDNNAQQSRQAALQQQRAVEAGNEQARWQSEGVNDGTRYGPGSRPEGQGPHGPQPGNAPGTGHLPSPGEVLSDVLGKADAAVHDLLGQNGAGPLGKPGELATNLLNQAGASPLGKPGELAANLLNQAGQASQAATGLAARALDATPMAGVTTAASALLTQQAAAQALQLAAPGAQALAARNALHDAAISVPMPPSRDMAAPLQTASTNALASNTLVPGTNRAAEAALIPGRQDMAMPMRAEQAIADRSATVLPGSNPPPAAVDASRAVPMPVAAAPTVVPPSQSAAIVEGRPTNPVAGNERVGEVPRAADATQPIPAGHTGAAPARANRADEQAGESLAQRLARALLAFLGLGAAKDQDVDLEADEELLAQAAEANRWQRLQWLFWALAVAGYTCLVVALIIFVPGGKGFLDETRNPLGTPALILGLICSLGAWWLARKLAANAGPKPESGRSA
jgi:hypothetical protein